LYEEPDLSPADLFNYTQMAYAGSEERKTVPKYVPPWLDEVQRKVRNHPWNTTVGIFQSWDSDSDSEVPFSRICWKNQ
jgi:hypothetical protein